MRTAWKGPCESRFGGLIGVHEHSHMHSISAPGSCDCCGRGTLTVDFSSVARFIHFSRSSELHGAMSRVYMHHPGSIVVDL
jgi:hypothetical protein